MRSTNAFSWSLAKRVAGFSFSAEAVAGIDNLLDYATGADCLRVPRSFPSWTRSGQGEDGVIHAVHMPMVRTSVLIWTFRTRLSVPTRLLSGISCATRHKASRRRPRDFRP